MSSTIVNTFPFPYTNPGGEGGAVVVVRHGERVDEVKGLNEEWHKKCRQLHGHCKHTFFCRVSDPPLTKKGKLQARKVAESLSRELLNAPERPQVVFSSKLIRSLMTAYEIAKELKVPICVSGGFSLTAAAVVKAKRRFTFLSMEELQLLCPGVLLIDGDTDVFPFPIPVSVPATTTSQQQQQQPSTPSCASSFYSDFSPTASHTPTTPRMGYLPNRTWQQSLQFLSNWKCSLVVAHRESIRNLSGQFLKTPYCCYGVFTFHASTGALRDELAPRMRHLATRNGVPIPFHDVVEGDDDDEEEEVVDFLA
jgi:broad specificity phosphatase PhoE